MYYTGSQQQKYGLNFNQLNINLNSNDFFMLNFVKKVANPQKMLLLHVAVYSNFV